MASTRYAEGTSVTPEQTIAEIRQLLRRFGGDGFTHGESMRDSMALIEFELHDRRVRFVIDLPKREAFVKTPSGRQARSASTIDTEWEKAIRQKYRSVALAIKGKLVSVQESIFLFEQEFAMYFVTGSGRTIYEEIGARLPEICSTGTMPSLLPAPADRIAHNGSSANGSGHSEK